jgi:hypothetical protein
VDELQRQEGARIFERAKRGNYCPWCLHDLYNQAQCLECGAKQVETVEEFLTMEIPEAFR